MLNIQYIYSYFIKNALVTISVLIDIWEHRFVSVKGSSFLFCWRSSLLSGSVYSLHCTLYSRKCFFDKFKILSFHLANLLELCWSVSKLLDSFKSLFSISLTFFAFSRVRLFMIFHLSSICSILYQYIPSSLRLNNIVCVIMQFFYYSFMRN